MKTHVSAINAFCIGLLLVALPRYAFSAGVGEDLYYPACNPVNSISAKFTSVEATYEAQAVCASPGSLKSSIVFQLTATGSYAKNIAKETIIVPAAQLSQPSHPYGKWEATYSCTNDPWLTGEDCQVISATPDTQLRNQSFAGLINRLRAVRPISAGLDSSTRTVLAARRDSDLKAERERALVSGGGSAKVFAAPTILAPIARQSFFAQTPIPIKLGLPQGWGAAGYYTVNIGRKDQTGNWGSPVQISVSVVDAQSQSGFTGFGGALGGGVIGPYTSTPGSWHLRAQIVSPRVSDWSDWVEFTVTAPPAAAVKGTLKGFGK